jgi:hypothetical protein
VHLRPAEIAVGKLGNALFLQPQYTVKHILERLIEQNLNFLIVHPLVSLRRRQRNSFALRANAIYHIPFQLKTIRVSEPGSSTANSTRLYGCHYILYQVMLREVPNGGFEQPQIDRPGTF